MNSESVTQLLFDLWIKNRIICANRYHETLFFGDTELFIKIMYVLMCI